MASATLFNPFATGGGRSANGPPPATPTNAAATGYDPITGQANYAYTGGAFGTQPAATPIAPVAQQLGSQIPGLTGLNKNASGFLNSELTGQLAPDTIRAIQDASATQAVSSGMPGSNAIAGTLGGNNQARTLGLTSQQLQSQGLKDYSSFVPTVSSTQTVNPAIQAQVNTQNAVNAAAPAPAAAASYAQQLFQQDPNQLNQHPAPGKNEEFFTPVGSNLQLPVSAA